MLKRLGAASAALVTITFIACQQPQEKGGETTPAAAATSPTNVTQAPAAVATITNLKGPESVLYDPDQDVYFISNVNGGFLDRDNNGFIARVNAETLQVDLQWVAGGKNGAVLHGGKGMAIVGDTLYVNDVDAVRKFNRKTGAPEGSVPIPGTTFLNDLTTDGTNVYASDTGALPGPGVSFPDTGTQAIYKISGNSVTRIASGAELKHPNGLAWAGGKLWIATFASNELLQLDSGKLASGATLPRGQLDGIVVLEDGTFVVSSWDGDAVYRGKPDGDWSVVLQGIDSPADLGYDTKRHRLLVPSTDVAIYNLR